MEQTTFKCSGDCLKCHPNQRAYCSSQFTYNTMRMVENIQNSLTMMQGTVEELKTKIEAIQGNESLLFDPTAEEKEEKPVNPHLITQEGDGV